MQVLSTSRQTQLGDGGRAMPNPPHRWPGPGVQLGEGGLEPPTSTVGSRPIRRLLIPLVESLALHPVVKVAPARVLLDRGRTFGGVTWMELPSELT